MPFSLYTILYFVHTGILLYYAIIFYPKPLYFVHTLTTSCQGFKMMVKEARVKKARFDRLQRQRLVQQRAEATIRQALITKENKAAKAIQVAGCTFLCWISLRNVQRIERHRCIVSNEFLLPILWHSPRFLILIRNETGIAKFVSIFFFVHRCRIELDCR